MVKYFALYTESGTNEKIRTDYFDTIEEARRACRSEAYSAKQETIRIYAAPQDD